jgi:hypothetical protein
MKAVTPAIGPHMKIVSSRAPRNDRRLGYH